MNIVDNLIKDKFKGQTLVTNDDYVFGIPHLHKILPWNLLLMSLYL